MLELLLETSRMIVSFVKEDLSRSHLYALAGLPFLLMVSECLIRKVIGQPFANQKEFVQTFGYLVIGVIFYQTFFLGMIRFVEYIPFISTNWGVEEGISIGIITLTAAAVLSPLTSLYIRFESVSLQITYLLGHSVLYDCLIGWGSTYLEERPQIPILVYILFAALYITLIIVITKMNDERKKTGTYRTAA
ncbi:hypothetical protein [Marinicrinis lubricantis]|uniref:Uncharacterized protein n=1 Tax=Marinicrinis lubricantis TaxID=2086470 RepID=A0ABW1IKP5_9BACL